MNRVNVIDEVTEEYSQELLGFTNNASSGNPTPSSEPIISDSSPSLTKFEGSDFLLKDVDEFLAVDTSSSPEVDDSYRDPEGDILLLELLNEDQTLLPLRCTLKWQMLKKLNRLLRILRSSILRIYLLISNTLS